MKEHTSYLDLEERNGLVYKIGSATSFTGLVRVPFLDLTGKLYYSKSYQDYFYGSAKAEGKEFLSSCLFTYQDHAENCDVASILDTKAGYEEEHIRDFVCEFRYKSGLKHGISTELILLGSGYMGEYFKIIEEAFIAGKCEQIAFFNLHNERITARGSCNENFMVGFDSSGQFPDEVKEGLWEEYYGTGKLESRGTFVNGERDGLFEPF